MARLTARVQVVGVPGSERVVHIDLAAPPAPPPGGVVRDALARPSAFGWPDATNTGPRPGVALRESAGVKVTKAGTVLRGLRILGGVDVAAARNVVIEDCEIVSEPGAGFGNVRTTGDCAGLVLRHCRLTYRNPKHATACIGPHSYTLENCHIVGVTEGPRINGPNVTIRGCFFERMVRLPDAHIDAIQITGGSNIVIEDNTITPGTVTGGKVTDPFNAAILCKADLMPIKGVWIRRNLLAHGNYTLYVQSAKYPASDIEVVDNRFGRGPQWGPRYGHSSRNVNVTWRGNVWDDTGQPV